MNKRIFSLLMMLTIWCVFTALSEIIPHQHHQQKIFTLSGYAQGTTYTIKYIYHDSMISKTHIDSMLNTIDNSLSLYLPNSIISSFNRSKQGVLMDEHMKKVVSKSIETYRFSRGCFDITCKPLSDLWGFGSQKRSSAPTAKQINEVLRLVGSDKLFIKRDSLFKSIHDVQIDCNGIAQGYTVDVIYDFIKQKNISDFIVELGGEIRTSGFNEKAKPWVIGIESPENSFGNEFLVDKLIALSNFAVTTSGSYRKFKKIGTKYLNHIIDPLSGFPVDNGIISVTVIAATAMEADALDNTCLLLGINRSFELLEKIPETGLHIVYKSPSGEIRDTSNLFFKKFLVHQESGYIRTMRRP